MRKMLFFYFPYIYIIKFLKLTPLVKLYMNKCENDNLNTITNKNCITRLSRYKAALSHFKELGFSKIFSTYLAQAVGVTSTVIRKDFSLFKIHGKKRGGYSIDLLIACLNSILNKNETQKVILVGVGNLGSALLNYRGFEHEGFRLLAAFDIDPSKINSSSDVPIYSLTELASFILENQIEFGIITVPAMVAQQVFDIMVNAGIKGVLNFAPCSLTCDDKTVFVNYVNLELELEQLVYFTKLKNKIVPFNQSVDQAFELPVVGVDREIKAMSVASD